MSISTQLHGFTWQGSPRRPTTAGHRWLQKLRRKPGLDVQLDGARKMLQNEAKNHTSSSPARLVKLVEVMSRFPSASCAKNRNCKLKHRLCTLLHSRWRAGRKSTSGSERTSRHGKCGKLFQQVSVNCVISHNRALLEQHQDTEEVTARYEDDEETMLRVSKCEQRTRATQRGKKNIQTHSVDWRVDGNPTRSCRPRTARPQPCR